MTAKRRSEDTTPRPDIAAPFFPWVLGDCFKRSFGPLQKGAADQPSYPGEQSSSSSTLWILCADDRFALVSDANL